jgi:hypothetical protein
VINKNIILQLKVQSVSLVINKRISGVMVNVLALNGLNGEFAPNLSNQRL